MSAQDTATQTGLQTAPADTELLAKLQGLTGSLAEVQRTRFGVAARFAEATATMVDDEASDDDVLSARGVLRECRADLKVADAEIARIEGEIKSLGEGALSVALVQADAVGKRFTEAFKAAIGGGETERATAHETLNLALDSRRQLVTLRAQLGIEEKRPRAASGGGAGGAIDRAPAGVVYVNKDGDLIFRSGPDVFAVVDRVLTMVEGSMLKDRSFKWGERPNSHETVVAKDSLPQVITVANAHLENTATETREDKDARRQLEKLIKHATTVVEGGTTQLA